MTTTRPQDEIVRILASLKLSGVKNVALTTMEGRSLGSTVTDTAREVQARRAERRIHRHRHQDLGRAQSRRPRSDPDPEQQRRAAAQRRRAEGPAFGRHRARRRLDAHRPRDEARRRPAAHDGLTRDASHSSHSVMPRPVFDETSKIGIDGRAKWMFRTAVSRSNSTLRPGRSS